MYQGGYMIESISVSDLKLLGDINIIDIRSIEKYNSKHILNAKNIPMEQLLINPGRYMNKYETYYIYCQKGIQSRKLCQILKNNGYNAINITGGYEAWILNE